MATQSRKGSAAKATKPNSPALRFAALIRVSTEKQKQQGESLRVQKQRVESDVLLTSPNSKIVEWYGGQEHATPGWEKGEFDRLLRDAGRGIFDAVIIAYPDRWSRDNGKSDERLKILRRHGIRFFIGAVETHLNDPNHYFNQTIQVAFGELSAAIQKHKSVQSRVARAQRGWPTCGKLPTARTFDKHTEKWAVDQEQQSVLIDIATRYLADEGLEKLAEEHGLKKANLHRTLMERCGDTWPQRFWDDVAKDYVTVLTPVPRLLPAKTIEAMRRKATHNRTYAAKEKSKYFYNDYLLRGFIVCEHCGYRLTGQESHRERPGGGTLTYRHAHGERERDCPIKKCHIKAKQIEERVVERLFEVFGNPKAVERAIVDAIPNHGDIAELQGQRSRVLKAMETLAERKNRLIDACAEGVFTKAEVATKKRELDEQEDKHRSNLRRIDDQLRNVPDAGHLLQVSQEFAEDIKNSLFPTRASQRKIPHFVPDANGRLNTKLYFKTMAADDAIESWDDKRALIKAVFDGLTPDGKQAGVYIRWFQDENGATKFRYVIRGIIPLLPTSDQPSAAAIVSACH
jgi:DNA invertase Pin-like site-specific DNA recombinase